MTSKLIPILVGGAVPALLYGVTGILQKLSTREGISTGLYLVCFGAATTLTGVVLHLVLREGASPGRAIGIALVAGLAFALGAGLITIALIRFQAPISQLAPLYNTNALITVILGLWLLREFAEVNLPRLLIGSILIVVGAILVADA
jgi:uncharacterized membrane protein